MAWYLSGMNWISDQIGRVMRTIREEIVDSVQNTIDDARETLRTIRELLDRALMPHPEARASVLRVFEEALDGGQ